jgi:hypothetical protein
MMPVEEQTRGERAQRLLEDETLNQALDAIEAEVIAMWTDCPMRDAEGKEALWQLYRTSKKFRAILSGYVQTGKLATENMSRHEPKRGLRAVFGR